MIIADSSVWIDYFNGVESLETNTLDKHLYEGEVHILDIIIAEVLQGFKKDKEYEAAKELLGLLYCHSVLSKDLAIQSASYFRHLREQGITVRKTIDMLIATWCIVHEVPLLENDKDFGFISSSLPLKTL